MLLEIPVALRVYVNRQAVLEIPESTFYKLIDHLRIYYSALYKAVFNREGKLYDYAHFYFADHKLQEPLSDIDLSEADTMALIVRMAGAEPV